MTSIAHAPLKWIKAPVELNARHAKEQGDIAELANSIASIGLIAPLVVRLDSDNVGREPRYQVIDGRRRHQALLRLAKAGRWNADVPVVIHAAEHVSTAIAMSLVANEQRLAMHPVDRFEAVKRMIDAGGAKADIAAQLGCELIDIERALALGGMHEEIRTAWRKAKLTAEVAKLYASMTDTDAQVALYKRLGRNAGHEWDVKREVNKSRVLIADVSPDVLAAYRKAGGKLGEDLFAAGEYVEDVAILEKAARKVLDETIKRLKKDGWKWVLCTSELKDDEHEWSYREVDGENEPHPTLQADADNKQELVDDCNPLEAPTTYAQRVAALEAATYAADKSAYTPAQIKALGVMICDSAEPYGLWQIHAGRSLPGATGPDAHHTSVPDSDDDGAEYTPAPVADDEIKAGGEVPDNNALLLAATQGMSIAAQRAAATDGMAALRLLYASLASGTGGYGAVRISEQGYFDPATTKHADRPKFAALLTLTASWDRTDLVTALAPLIAAGINLEAYNAMSMKGAKEADTAAVIAAVPREIYLREARGALLSIDYFKRCSREDLLTILNDMRVTHDANAKKAALVEIASARAQETGWLPVFMRAPDGAPAPAKKRGSK